MRALQSELNGYRPNFFVATIRGYLADQCGWMWWCIRLQSTNKHLPRIFTANLWWCTTLFFQSSDTYWQFGPQCHFPFHSLASLFGWCGCVRLLCSFPSIHHTANNECFQFCAMCSQLNNIPEFSFVALRPLVWKVNENVLIQLFTVIYSYLQLFTMCVWLSISGNCL